MSKNDNKSKNNNNSNDKKSDNKKNPKVSYRQKLQDVIEGRLSMDASIKVLDKMSDYASFSDREYYREIMSFALELALKNKRYDLFNFLIDKIIKLEQRSTQFFKQFSTLHHLSTFLINNMDKTELCIAIIDAMVARNISLERNIYYDYYSPLETAINKDNNKIIEVLILNGVNLSKHVYDSSPLIFALLSHRVEAAKLIIKAMSEKNISFDSHNRTIVSFTALGIALRMNQMEIVESLIAEGAAIDDSKSKHHLLNNLITDTIQNYVSELRNIFYHPKDSIFKWDKDKKFNESELKIKVDEFINTVKTNGHEKYLKSIFNSARLDKIALVNHTLLLLDFLYSNYHNYYNRITPALPDHEDLTLFDHARSENKKTFDQVSFLFDKNDKTLEKMLEPYGIPEVLIPIIREYLSLGLLKYKDDKDQKSITNVRSPDDLETERKQLMEDQDQEYKDALEMDRKNGLLTDEKKNILGENILEDSKHNSSESFSNTNLPYSFSSSSSSSSTNNSFVNNSFVSNSSSSSTTSASSSNITSSQSSEEKRSLRAAAAANRIELQSSSTQNPNTSSSDSKEKTQSSSDGPSSNPTKRSKFPAAKVKKPEDKDKSKD